MPIGICLQFFIRRHARRIGAFRKCERIGRGSAKRLAGSGSPKFERWRSQRAGQSPTKVRNWCKTGNRSMPTRASAYRRKWPLRGTHLKTEFAPTADPPVRPQNGLYAPSAAISFPPNLAAGVAETQITNRREDRSHPKPGHLCESTLTSSGFTRSGTVQPSMSYSAMH